MTPRSLRLAYAFGIIGAPRNGAVFYVHMLV